MRRYTYTHILKAKSNRSIYIPFLTFEHSKANTKVTSAQEIIGKFTETILNMIISKHLPSKVCL